MKIIHKELHRCRACGGIAEWHYPESRRFEFLKLADQVKHLPKHDACREVVTQYAAQKSWLPQDIAALAFSSLADALQERRMADVSQALNELTAGMDGAA